MCVCDGIYIHLCISMTYTHLVCIILCVTLKVKGATSAVPAGKPVSGAKAVSQQVCVLCVCSTWWLCMEESMPNV